MRKCRLCLKEKKLIKSHIIPEFMFEKMKDENNTFFQLTYDADKRDSKKRKVQTGVFDKNILCEDCDNKILGGIYESYAKKSFYGKNLNPEIAPKCKNFKNPKNGTEYSICENIQYSKFKLFLLSLLWRASITSQPMFNEVNIGSKHEEILRDYLLNNLCPNEHEYPIFITSFLRTDNPLDNLVGQPKRFKDRDGFNGYIFYINSFQFTFGVNSPNHKIPIYFKNCLTESGELKIIHFKNGQEKQFMKAVLRV